VRVLQSLSGLSAPHFLSGSYCFVLWGMMSEPTIDEIVEKAKQLCRLDGMLWSNLDFQNPMAQQIRTTARLAGEAVCRGYLKRARCLTRKPDVSSLEARASRTPPCTGRAGQSRRSRFPKAPTLDHWGIVWPASPHAPSPFAR
jgi:hypothetical protein